jgi:hypothetical protein
MYREIIKPITDVYIHTSLCFSTHGLLTLIEKYNCKQYAIIREKFFFKTDKNEIIEVDQNGQAKFRATLPLFETPMWFDTEDLSEKLRKNTTVTISDKTLFFY